MTWAHPEAFFLFIPLALGIFFVLNWGARNRLRLDFLFDEDLKNRPKERGFTPFRLSFWLRTLALSSLIIGLARPQMQHDKVKRNVEAVDMILCFDLSKSMDAIDFLPNRRAVALNTIQEFIEMRKEDRIGLVLFSGEAFLATPLTLDHKIVKTHLTQITNRNLQDGTAIGQAIAVAVSHLRHSKALSRVIILVTDGDNNMGSVDPLTAAELAKGYGLKVYTIAIGKRGRVAFPVKTVDPFGREITVQNFLTDAINEELLQKIADHTGGRFFRAAEDGVLDNIFKTIDKLEKTKVEEFSYTIYTEKAWVWVFFALALILIEALALNTRWRKFP